MTHSARTATTLFVLALALSFASSARAHDVGVSKGEYAAHGESVSVRLTLAKREAAALLAVPVDAPPAVAVASSKLEPLVHVTRGGTLCTAHLTSLVEHEADWVAELGFDGCGADSAVHFDLAPLFAELKPGHTHAAFLDDASGPRDDSLHAGRAALDLSAGGTLSPPPPPAASHVAWDYFVTGIEHILSGYDHIAFLLGLLVIGGRLKHLLWMITAFTVSHSITLALSVLGVLAPSPSIIEPIIALSVAYVGVENFVVKDAEKRWRITGLFGFIHGFGFAGALGEVGIPRGHLALGLATFNLGVEAGQLMILSLFLPLVYLASRKPWFKLHGVRAFSVGVVLLGLVWFVARILPGA